MSIRIPDDFICHDCGLKVLDTEACHNDGSTCTSCCPCHADEAPQTFDRLAMRWLHENSNEEFWEAAKLVANSGDYEWVWDPNAVGVAGLVHRVGSNRAAIIVWLEEQGASFSDFDHNYEVLGL